MQHLSVQYLWGYDFIPYSSLVIRLQLTGKPYLHFYFPLHGWQKPLFRNPAFNYNIVYLVGTISPTEILKRYEAVILTAGTSCWMMRYMCSVKMLFLGHPLKLTVNFPRGSTSRLAYLKWKWHRLGKHPMSTGNTGINQCECCAAALTASRISGLIHISITVTFPSFSSVQGAALGWRLLRKALQHCTKAAHWECLRSCKSAFYTFCSPHALLLLNKHTSSFCFLFAQSQFPCLSHLVISFTCPQLSSPSSHCISSPHSWQISTFLWYQLREKTHSSLSVRAFTGQLERTKCAQNNHKKPQH